MFLTTSIGEPPSFTSAPRVARHYSTYSRYTGDHLDYTVGIGGGIIIDSGHFTAI